MLYDLGTILVAAVANPNIGMRRINRAQSLAQAFRSLGAKVFFLDQPLPGTVRKAIQNSGFDFIPSTVSTATNSGNGVFEFQSVLDACDSDWIVADGLPANALKSTNLESHNVRLLTIDNEKRGDWPVDIAVSPWATSHSALTTGATRLQGPDYAPLDFTAREGLTQKKITSSIKRLLVWPGSSAHPGMALLVLNAIAECRVPKLSIDLVLDHENQDFDSIAQLARNYPYSIRLHRQTDRALAQLGQMDLAIVGPNSNCWEFAFHGIPMILLDSSDEIASHYEDRAPFVQIDPLTRTDILAKRIQSIALSKQTRRQLSDRGNILVDGKGVVRIARCAAVYEFSFRNATMEDARMLHEWRNDPETRAMSFDQGPTPFEDHSRWMVEKIRSLDDQISIIEDRNRRPVGTFQLEFSCETPSAALNIFLIPAMRGRGLGTALLERICRESLSSRSVSEFTANIRPNHPMAQAAFGNAGFRATGLTQINGQLATSFAYQPNLVPQPMARPELRKAS